ncbi:hypothetical protein Mal33_09400 [Rosistilla oblonga]|uniref:DUF1559 domain-containing protein n=1 Tax=Rosistilla oblonga TaxID=2527990 RepID=A0A518IPH2_9BACT|nr:hypothetical protein Mal33_09400 [Rosistilla oblonga]
MSITGRLNSTVDCCPAAASASGGVGFPALVGYAWGGRSSNSVSLDRTTERSIDERELCFSSRHRGGVQAVLVDGHVKFFAETIDPQIWSALGTRNNGEVIPDSL